MHTFTDGSSLHMMLKCLLFHHGVDTGQWILEPIQFIMHQSMYLLGQNSLVYFSLASMSLWIVSSKKRVTIILHSWPTFAQAFKFLVVDPAGHAFAFFFLRVLRSTLLVIATWPGTCHHNHLIVYFHAFSLVFVSINQHIVKKNSFFKHFQDINLLLLVAKVHNLVPYPFLWSTMFFW